MGQLSTGARWGGYAALAGSLLVVAPAEAQISRLNLRPDGGQSGSQWWEQASDVSASDDGRFVAFISTAADLVPGDTNDVADAFVLDRLTGDLRLVTRQPAGPVAETPAIQPNNSVAELRISGDGSTLVFVSSFADLVIGDTNESLDVFAHDRVSGTTTRVSVGAGGQESQAYGHPHVASPDVSSDGTVIVYATQSAVLTGRPSYEMATVVVDRHTGLSTTVVFGATTPYVSIPRQVRVSGNGRFVVSTTAAALVPDDTNAANDVYLHDRNTSTFERLSVTSAGAQSTGGGIRGSRNPSIDHDGRLVTFESDSRTLAPPPGPADGYVPTQIFLRDRSLQTTTRVSESAAGVGGSLDSTGAQVSPDGRLVAFLADSPTEFVPVRYSDRDALVWTRETRRFRTVNIPMDYMPSPGSDRRVFNVWPTLSDHVLFVSGQANLVANDTGRGADVFVRTMTQPEPTITSMTPNSGPRDATAEVVITGTGFVPGATRVFVQGASLYPLTPSHVTATSLSITLPGGQGARTISVATPSGLAATTFSSGFCGFTVSPTLLVVPTGGGQYPIAITPAPGADADCPWTAITGSPATIDGTTFVSRVGGGTLTVAVPPHPGDFGRELFVHAADVRVRIPQAGKTGAPLAATVGGTATTVSIPLSAGTARVSVHDVTTPAILAIQDGAFDPATRTPHPPAFRFLTARAYRVGADALFREAEVCLPYLDADISESVVFTNGLRLFRWSPTHYVWTDVTTSVEADVRRVCGRTTTWGEFAIAYAATTRYLSEGATSAFFDTQLALLNPGQTDSTVSLTFLRGGQQAPVTHVTTVPARTRATIHAKDVPGLAAAEFSTVVHADQFLVVDRTMRWDAGAYGAHAETAVAAPSPVWYLAEGATHSGFALFYLLQNPEARPVDVKVRYLLPTGGPLEKIYTLPPNSRTNIWVNVEEFAGLGAALASTDVSAVIQTIDDTPIIVERAMYLSNQGRVFNAGHASMGVTTPAREWLLAEGATGDYFDLFILIANPTNQDADVLVVYRLVGGGYYTRNLVAPANSRTSIWVDQETIPGVAGLPLANVAVSTAVASTNNVPIIVERAMWWPGGSPTWHEAHNSAGSTATGTRWALAEGEVGGARNADTYILISNSSGRETDATVTLLLEDGTSLSRVYRLAASSRTNVAVRDDFGAAVLHRRFGALVETSEGVPIVVERAMYSDAGGVRWAAGTNALGTRLP